jgi:hypothetical protein
MMNPNHSTTMATALFGAAQSLLNTQSLKEEMILKTSIKEEMVEIQTDNPTQEIFTLNASLHTHLS